MVQPTAGDGILMENLVRLMALSLFLPGSPYFLRIELSQQFQQAITTHVLFLTMEPLGAGD